MRSLVVKNVMSRQIKAMKANSRMVRLHPRLASDPPRRSISGSVKPCTANWAMVLATNLTVLMLVRSFMLAVITPPSEA